MEAAAFAAQSEAIVFLSYFADFPDPRQPARWFIRFKRSCCCACSPCSPGRRPSSISRGSARRRSYCCAGSCRSTMGRHRTTTVDGDHGRIETRTYTAIRDVAWLQERHQWPGLQGVVMVESERVIPGASRQADKIERETRFYITSLLWVASQLGPAIRAHWMVENGLHWVMDMMFRDDECRIRTDHAPANFTTIKHMALNLIRRAPGKDSLRLRRKVAAWDDDFLASLIAA